MGKMYYEQMGYEFDPPFYSLTSVPVITNYDRVIRKTPEKLATYLNNMQGVAYINGFDNEPIRLYPNNYGAWLDWLRQEAEEET